MSEDNIVIVQDLDKFKILIPAPGASVENTTVRVDKGKKCQGSDESGRVHIKVGEPLLNKDLLDKVDFTISTSIVVPSQYDLSTARVNVKYGIIVIRFLSAKDRIVSVPIAE